MPRRVRFIPEDGALVEVSCRTIQSRYLLRPSPALNEIILGVLGRAQRLYPVQICGFVFLSNHYHLTLRVPDAERLADFMEYVQSNLAREVCRLHGWKDKVWSRRYSAIVISDEEAAQVDRFRYVLANGCKEGLVASPRDWPGVNMIAAVLDRKPLTGTWFDRTKEYAARLRGESFTRYQYSTEETVVLSPLPCWRRLTPDQYRERVASLVQEIEAEAAAERKRTGIQPLGAAAILRQQPHTWPNKTKKSPSPGFHAATKAARKELWEAYARFVAAFREASEKLRNGDRKAYFPIGSFPPGLPFVRMCPGPAP